MRLNFKMPNTICVAITMETAINIPVLLYKFVLDLLLLVLTQKILSIFNYQENFPNYLLKLLRFILIKKLY